MSENQNKLLLVAEDSAFTRYSIVTILKELEFVDFIEAENGTQVLALLKNHKPDCVLLDLLMPETGGVEVLEEMMKTGSSIPVIVLTADIQDTTHQRCLKLGVKAFIKKPLEAAILLSTVKEVLNI